MRRRLIERRNERHQVADVVEHVATDHHACPTRPIRNLRPAADDRDVGRAVLEHCRRAIHRDDAFGGRAER